MKPARADLLLAADALSDGADDDEARASAADRFVWAEDIAADARELAARLRRVAEWLREVE